MKFDFRRYLLAEFMKLSPGQRRNGETSTEERNAMIDVCYLLLFFKSFFFNKMLQHTRKTPTDKMNEINKILREIIANLKNININLGISVESINYFITV